MSEVLASSFSKSAGSTGFTWYPPAGVGAGIDTWHPFPRRPEAQKDPRSAILRAVMAPSGVVEVEKGPSTSDDNLALRTLP